MYQKDGDSCGVSVGKYKRFDNFETAKIGRRRCTGIYREAFSVIIQLMIFK